MDQGNDHDREARFRHLEDGQEELGRRIGKLEAFQNWVIGAASGLTFTAGLFAKQAWAYLTGH